MSGKQRKRRVVVKRASRRDEENSAIPAGAVLANTSRQVPNNSYSPPPQYYIDKPFACVDCGAAEVWTAHQQKWYYEVAKGSLHATAIRCRPCRRRHRYGGGSQGDPNPIKHIGALIKRVQSALAQTLSGAGFVLVSKSKLPVTGSVALNYSRDDLELTCWYDRPNATLVAESLDKHANCSVIASVSMSAPRSTTQALDRIEEFANSVNQYVAELPSCEGDTEVEMT